MFRKSVLAIRYIRQGGPHPNASGSMGRSNASVELANSNVHSDLSVCLADHLRRPAHHRPCSYSGIAVARLVSFILTVLLLHLVNVYLRFARCTILEYTTPRGSVSVRLLRTTV